MNDLARDRLLLLELASEFKLLRAKIPRPVFVLTDEAKELVKDIDAAIGIAIDECKGFGHGE